MPNRLSRPSQKASCRAIDAVDHQQVISGLEDSKQGGRNGRNAGWRRPTPAHCGPSRAIRASWSALVVGVPWRPYWNSPRWACRSSAVGYSTVDPRTMGGLTNPFCAIVSRPDVTSSVRGSSGFEDEAFFGDIMGQSLSKRAADVSQSARCAAGCCIQVDSPVSWPR